MPAERASGWRAFRKSVLKDTALHSALEAAVEPRWPDSRVALLIDQSAYPNLNAAADLIGALRPIGLLADHEDPFDSANPLLIEYASPAGPELLRWLSSQGRFTNALLVLHTDLPSNDLRDALRIRSRVRLETEPEPDMLLRYFDTRIFEAMLQVLPKQKMREFLSCAHVWHYLDRDGNLQSVDGAQAAAALTFFELNTREQHRLIEASEPDAIESMLAEYMPARLEAATGAERYRMLRCAIERARVHGVCELNELAPFCVLDLTLQSGWDDTEVWRSLWPKVKDGSMRFNDAMQKALDQYL